LDDEVQRAFGTLPKGWMGIIAAPDNPEEPDL